MSNINPNDVSLGFTLSNGNTVVQTAAPVPCVIGIAVDFTNKKIWAYNQASGQWNLGTIGTQNPATNTGGINLTTMMAAGAIFPTISYFTTPEVVTANFGATAFTLTMPSGFSAWGSSTTWNPADKSANITLSNGNLTATSAAAGAWCSGRATTGNTTGKLYYEITVTNTDTATGGTIMGLSLASMATNTFTGAVANSGGWQNTGNGQNYGSFTSAIGNYGNGLSWHLARSTPFKTSGKYVYECTINAQASGGIMIGWANANGSLANFSGSTSDSSGTGAQIGGQPIYYNGNTGGVGIAASSGTIMMAIDFANAKAWWYDPSTSKWNNGLIGAQNPATNTGGTTITTLAGTALGPSVSMFAITAGTDKVTFNFGATAFSNATPSGFLPWDSILIPAPPRRINNDDTDDDQEGLNTYKRIRTLLNGGPARIDDDLILTGNAGIAHAGTEVAQVSKSLSGRSATASIGTPDVNSGLALTGSSATAHVGTAVAEIDFALTGINATAHVGTPTRRVDENFTLTGVEATSALGTPTPDTLLDIQITGVQSTSNVGTPSIELDKDVSLAGVASTSHVGILSSVVNRDVSITGVASTAQAGVIDFSRFVSLNGLEAMASINDVFKIIKKNIGFPPTLFDPYRGVEATPQVGSFSFVSDRVLNGVSSAAQVGRLRLFGTLEGVEADAAIGHIAFAPTFSLVGQRSTSAVGLMFPHIGPNETNVFCPAVFASPHVGRPTITFSGGLQGVQSIAQTGDLSVLVFKTGMEISELTVTQLTNLQDDIGVSVRYSINGGQSWTQPIVKSLGFQGDYNRTLSFRNTGISRSMVYEISWACPFKTALGGGTINVEISGS